MFGKSEWFRFLGAFPFPKTKEGVWYLVAWLGSITVPAGLMFFFGLWIEMAIWLLISCLAMLIDVRTIRSGKIRREELDSLYHIDDENQEIGNRAETENYELNSQ